MEWEELKKNPVNNFQCDTCKSDLMPLAEFKKHLAKVHKLDTEKLQANRKMLMHIDGDYWFSSTYEWILPGLQFTQYVQFAREKSHMF